LNWLIVDAMLTVKELMLTAGTEAEAAGADDDEPAEDDELDELDEFDEDEQPAAARARAAARATQLILGRRRNGRPPSLLLLTRIPHTFRPNVPNKADRDTGGAAASLRREVSAFDIGNPGPDDDDVELRPADARHLLAG
jgi:hypothetical protein